MATPTPQEIMRVKALGFLHNLTIKEVTKEDILHIYKKLWEA